ncbi:hypothetical protein M427DRAFT_99797, partial [Gonapodya prolifera JEL478]
KSYINTNIYVHGSKRIGTFLSVNDLTTGKLRGCSVIGPGSASTERLNIQSPAQSFVSQEGGDNLTGTKIKLDLQGIQLDLAMTPTGRHFYYGGSGGLQMVPKGEPTDIDIVLYGWSWYWVLNFPKIRTTTVALPTLP